MRLQLLQLGLSLKASLRRFQRHQLSPWLNQLVMLLPPLQPGRSLKASQHRLHSHQLSQWLS